MSIIWLLFLFLATTSYIYRVDGKPAISKEEDLELERQLKLINKPPIKSIQTEYGYIVDCIDIEKQLAFDHPLLKNQKLQRKPSFQHRKQARDTISSQTRFSSIGLHQVLCPTGTVPIRRTTKDDLIRAKLFSNNTHILTQDNPGTHTAQVSLSKIGNQLYGVSGVLSAYKLVVEKTQMSAAHIWVQSGENDGLNIIYVGWQIFPQLYGDDNAYFYTAWTKDNFKTSGCYNMRCAGFVQTDRRIYPGLPLSNTSIYGGTQSEMNISLTQDLKSSNWWLRAENIDIGYFPDTIFNNLPSAEKVGWGGQTTAPLNGPSPPMGSGYFPDDNFVHADYFRQIAYKNQTLIDYAPLQNMTESYSDNSNCYGVNYYGYLDQFLGYCLQFGGPGGKCGN